MNQGNSNLNTSSLIDLKAELHKKYESFRNLKLNQSARQLQPKRTHFKNKGEAVKGKKLKQTIEQPKEVDNEEEISLKKSRLALETKAKLYENIMSNNIDIDEEQKECYLVDFERKVLYNSKEFENKETNEVINNSDTTETISSYKDDLKSKTFLKYQASSTNQRDDSLQEKTEQPIHYQNVQYNEVRDHGTGYFAFSVDESKRKEQMEELGILRQETEEQRIKNQRLQRKRKALLEARLAKICERKNIDQSVLKTYVENSDEITETKESDISQTSEVDLSAIPLPEVQTNSEKEQTEKKPRKIRPWDVGKDNLNFIPEKKIKSQNQWIEEKREERHAEFAPPPSYSNYKL